MTKQTKDGWIRHRGGKCPVDGGVRVDYRMRSSEIWADVAGDLRWEQSGDDYDIMSYRVCEPVIEPVSVDQIEVGIEAADLGKLAPIEVVKAAYAGPIQLRDRITQIDSDIKFEQERHSSNMACMDQERADLVAKPAAEGFALIAAAVEAVEDMGDWRNWKAGDIVAVVIENDADLKVGSTHTVRSVEKRSYNGVMPISVWADRGERLWPEPQEEQTQCVFKFHSRPTN